MSLVDAPGRGASTRTYKAPEVYYEDRQTTAIDVYALDLKPEDRRTGKMSY